MVQFARVPLIGIVVALCATRALATVERSVTYESRDLVYGPNISYWNYVTSENGLCGNGYSESTSATFGSVSLQFTGIAVSLDMVRSVNGTKVAIDLDGSRVDEIDTYLDRVDCTTPVFQKSGLDYGKHTIVLSDLSDLPRQMRFEGFRYTTYTEDEIAAMAANSTSTTPTHTKDGRRLHIGIIVLLAIIALFVILGFILGCIWFFRRRSTNNGQGGSGPAVIALEMGPGSPRSPSLVGGSRVAAQTLSGGSPQTTHGGPIGLTMDDPLIRSMQQRIDSLSATVEEMKAQRADAAVINGSLTATNDEVAALGRKVLEIERKTEGLGSSVGYTRNSLSEFGESTHQRLSGFDYRVPAPETTMSSLEHPLAAGQSKPMTVEYLTKSDLQQLADRLDSSLNAVKDQLRDHTTTTHDHITHLDNNVSAVEAKIIGMEFDTHKDHLSSAQKAITRLETTANENQAGLASLNELSQGRLTDLERSVTETQEELTRTEQSVEDKHTKVQAAQAAIAELEARMNRADQEVSNLQQVSDSTQQKVAVIGRSLGETREGLPRIIENTFRDSQVIQSTMESSMEKQCTTIVGAMQDQLRDHAATTQDHISRLDNNVSAIEAQIIGMEFDTHKDHLSSAQKAIAMLETTANENQAGLASLNDLSQGRLTDLERRVTETQEELTRTKQSVEDKHTKVEAAQATIAELETRMNQADQEVSNLQQVSDSTQQKVAVIEQSLGETREGLPRIIENTFRDSQVIQSTVESSVEKQCTTIVGATQDQLRDHATTTHDHITRLDNEVSTMKAQVIGMEFNTHKDRLSSAQIAIARLETTANENQAGLASLNDLSRGRLTDLERRVAETQEDLGRTKQSVEDNHTEVQAARSMIGELETRMSQANREMSSLQQASNSTQKQVAVVEKSLDKTWEDLPRIIESTFRDSQDIQSTMESRMETLCTTIIDSTLESNVAPRILVVETKANIMEEQLDSVQQDGATKKEVLSTQASLDNGVSAIRAELEKATHGLDDKVREIEVKLDNLEASLPELQHTITNTITNTIRESKEIHETIESTIHRSEVIREVITKTASLSNQMASVNTLRADLRDLNGLTEDMRNRVVRLEEMLVTGDTPSDLSDAGNERLTVPEDRFQARATLVVQLQTRVTRVERRIAQIIGESTKTRRDLDMVQQIAVGLRAARGRG